MFDYIPPEPGSEDDKGLSLGLVFVCCLIGILMWLGLLFIVEHAFGAIAW